MQDGMSSVIERQVSSPPGLAALLRRDTQGEGSPLILDLIDQLKSERIATLEGARPHLIGSVGPIKAELGQQRRVPWVRGPHAGGPNVESPEAESSLGIGACLRRESAKARLEVRLTKADVHDGRLARVSPYESPRDWVTKLIEDDSGQGAADSRQTSRS